MRIIDPGTMPPPSTKSNSSIPVFQRVGARSRLTSRERRRERDASAFGERPRPADAPRRTAAGAAATLGATISSTSVFHSPHVSQRPCHLACSAPHSVQR